MVRDRGSFTLDHQYSESNGHVIDDVAWPWPNMFGSNYLESGWRYRLGCNGPPIRNDTKGYQMVTCPMTSSDIENSRLWPSIYLGHWVTLDRLMFIWTLSCHNRIMNFYMGQNNEWAWSRSREQTGKFTSPLLYSLIPFKLKRLNFA